MTTDTPRTDAVVSEPCAIHQAMQKWEKIIENSRQLERELAESKAEVDRLKKELSAWDYGTRAKREQERAKKAEAEVERLRGIANRAISMLVIVAYEDRL